MADDDLVNKVVIEGEQEAVDSFDRIGKSGEDAFNKMGKAAETANEPIGAIAAAARRAGISVEEMQARVAAAGQSTKVLATSSAEAAVALETEAVAAALTANEIRAAEVETRKFAISARSAGAALQLFSRLAHVPEITQLGRAIRLLSRGLSALAAPVALVFMDRLASSAATAAREQEQLAQKANLTATEFGDLASAGTAVGVSNEEFGKSLDAVGKLLKEGQQATEHYVEAQAQFKEKIEQSRATASSLADALGQLAVVGTRAFRELRIQQENFSNQQADSGLQFVRALRNIQEQRDAILTGGVSAATQRQRQLRDNAEAEQELIRKRSEATRKAADDQIKLNERQADESRNQAKALSDLIDKQVAVDKAIRDTERAASLSTAAFEKNKTALQKLGITETDNNGKLKQNGDALLEIADKLQKLPEGLDKIKTRSALVAAGIDKDLIPALEQGAEGFRRLQTLGSQIRPPFSDAQIASANKFAIVAGQAGDALGSLKDQLGSALQPAFVNFFEKIRDTVILLRGPLSDFGNILTQFVKPALDGIAVIITNVLTPAFQGLSSFFGFIADQLNKLFGTDQFNGATLFAVAVIAISAAFGSMIGPITLLVAALGTLLTQFKDNEVIIALILIAITALAAVFGSIPIAIGLAAVAVGFIIAKWDALKKAASDTATAIVDFFQPVVDFFNKMLAKMGEVKDKLAGLFGGNKADQIPVAGGFGGFAGGGQVAGPGTSTSDSILARLSRGEFVQKAKAVRYYGTNIMHALNNMQIPVKALRGFAQGGLVEMLGSPLMIPAFAGGGDVPIRQPLGASGRPIILDFGGNDKFSVTAEDSTAEKIGGYATRRRMASAGKRPSSWGSR